MNGPIGHSGPREDYSRWPVVWRTVVWGLPITALFTASLAGLVLWPAVLVTGGLVGWWWVVVVASTPVAALVGFTSSYDHADHVAGKWKGTGWESSVDYAKRNHPMNPRKAA